MVVSLLKLQKQRKQRCHAESHCPMSLLPCGLKMIETFLFLTLVSTSLNIWAELQSRLWINVSSL